jgi:hypothetical protein
LEVRENDINLNTKNMKTAMISQPMAGKTEQEILEEKVKATKELNKRGYEVVNTYFADEWTKKENLEKEGVKNIPLCFLARSLAKMSTCDAVYFCKGWHNARGCKVELEAAKSYGLDIIFADQIDD